MSKRYPEQNILIPMPLRSPSPDLISHNITSTKEVTLKTSIFKASVNNPRASISNELTQLRNENQRLKGLLDKLSQSSLHNELREKDKLIEELRTQVQDKNSNFVGQSYENQLLKRIRILQGQNQELWERINNGKNCSFSYEDELYDIKEYVVSHLNETAGKLKIKLNRQLDTLTSRLSSIEKKIDDTQETPHLSQETVSVDIARLTPEVSFKKIIVQLEKQLQESVSYQKQLESEIKYRITQNEQLEIDSLAIRGKLKEYEEMMIKYREENNSKRKAVGSNYGQLVQENQALSDTISSLRKNYNQLLSQHNKLVEHVESQDLSKEGRQNQTHFLQQENIQLLEQKNYLEEEIFNLRNSLKSELSKEKAVPSSSCTEEKDNLIHLLQTRNNQLVEDNQEALRLRQLAERERDLMKTQLLKQSGAVSTDNKKQIERLLFENGQLTREVQMLSLKQSNASINEQYLKELGSQYDSLLEEFNAMKMRNIDTEQLIVSFRNQNIHLKEAIATKENKQHELMSKLEQSKAESFKISEYERQIKSFLDQIDYNDGWLQEILSEVAGVKVLLTSISIEGLKTFILTGESKRRELARQVMTQSAANAHHLSSIGILESQLRSKDAQVLRLSQKINDLNFVIEGYVNSVSSLELHNNMQNLGMAVVSEFQSQPLSRLRTCYNHVFGRVGEIHLLAERVETDIRKAMQ